MRLYSAGLVEEPVLRKQFAIKYTQMVALSNPDKLFKIVFLAAIAAQYVTMSDGLSVCPKRV